MEQSLFVRRSTGLALTLAGEALAASARDALDRIADAASGARLRRLRPLTIGAYSYFASRMLLPFWPELRATHPDLVVDLHTSSNALDLIPGQYDAVIAVSDTGPRTGLVTHQLVPIATVPVCSSRWLENGRADFAKVPLLHARPRPDDWRRWLNHARLGSVQVPGGSSFESIGLAMLGFAVEGSDLSPMSIDRARREVTARGLKAEFRVDDMRSLSTAPIDSYDAVIAMDNAIPHLDSDEDIETALRAMLARLRSGGIALISLRNYGSLIASRPSSTPVSLYRDGKYRRFVHQVWDWQDDRRYVVHQFITVEKPDGWHTRHFVGHYRAISPNEVAALAKRAGFDDIRVLVPEETGYYQPVVRAVAPTLVATSG